MCSELGAFCNLANGKLDISLCRKYFRHLKSPSPTVGPPAAPRLVGFVSCVFYGVVWAILLSRSLSGKNVTSAVLGFIVGGSLAWKLQIGWVRVTVLAMSAVSGCASLVLLPLCSIGLVLQDQLGHFRLLSAVAALFIAPALGAFWGITSLRMVQQDVVPKIDQFGIVAFAEILAKLIGQSVIDTIAGLIGVAAALVLAIVPALIWHSLNAIVITTSIVLLLPITAIRLMFVSFK
jgi:hypothetical protein